MKFRMKQTAVIAALMLAGCAGSDQGATPSVASPNETAESTPEFVNPFLTPGTCRDVYLVTDSKDDGIAELRRLEDTFGKLGGRYGIYERNDGKLLAADSMERYFEDPQRFVSERLGRNLTVQRLQTNVRSRINRVQLQSARENGRYYHPSAYCSTGEEIVADTGVRYNNPTSTGGGGLIGAAIAFSLDTLREASKNAGTVTMAEPVQAQSQPAQSSNESTTSVASTAQMTITASGSSASGKPANTITCPNGREFRIWRSDGQWFDARGAQGGNSRNLNAQANFLCG